MTILRHGLTAADQGAMATLRARLAARPVAITRASYDALREQEPSADSVSYTEASIGGVPGVWCAASTSPGKARFCTCIGSRFAPAPTVRP